MNALFLVLPRTQKRQKYNTNSGDTKNENGSVEDNRAGNLSENTEGDVPEVRTLIQGTVKEQIKMFIAPLTRQLEEWAEPLPQD